jgi:hypothetical protein
MGQTMTNPILRLKQAFKSRLIGKFDRHSLLLMALIAVTLLRLIDHYRVTSATYDESCHIAAGMELVDQGKYTYDIHHPPLARVVPALPLYLKGIRSFGLKNCIEEGNAILRSTGSPHLNLTLARMGSLLFLLLAAWIVYLWSCRWFSRRTGLLALVILLNLPPVIGHGSLAALDVPGAAGLLTASYLILRWLEKPTTSGWIWMSFGIVLAVLTKFSNIVFLPLTILAIVVVYLMRGRTALQDLCWVRKVRLRQSIASLFLVFLLIPVCYRFYTTVVIPPSGTDQFVGRVFPPESLLHKTAVHLIETPTPWHPFVTGIYFVDAHNRVGHDGYLLGEFRRHGWWYFFLVVLLVKTPLGVLLGTPLLLWRGRDHSVFNHAHFCRIAPILILLFCLLVNINNGVRHILVLYFFGSIALADVLVQWWGRGGSCQWAVKGLLLLLLTESIFAHPFYVGHFNLLAGKSPERILADSDLDWGQDLLHLRRYLEEHNLSNVEIAYFGTAPVDEIIPERHRRPRSDAKEKYLAISLRYLYLENARQGLFQDLMQRDPIARIGSSIVLYRIR